MLGSISAAFQGESTAIELATGESLQAFSYLIMTAAGFLVALWGMMWCTIFKLEKWIGYVLLVMFVGYLVVFSIIYFSMDTEEEE